MHKREKSLGLDNTQTTRLQGGRLKKEREIFVNYQSVVIR